MWNGNKNTIKYKVETIKGKELVRITIIDFEFNKVLDELVKPENEITNYLTE